MADEEGQEPEQIKLMKRMVELAEYQVELAKQRTEMSADRSQMSEDRSRMSAERSQMSLDRSRMSEDRSKMSAERSTMSADRSTMSAQRSEMSEHRSYLNAERTLSVWTRTALALMVAGIAVDRFALLLRHGVSNVAPGQSQPHMLSTLGGAALVAFGTAMALACGIRYLVYARRWRREHTPLPWHGPYLAFSFAMLTVVFGVALLAAMLLIT
ncbi:MAG: YidH family protein [Rhodanobacteraceae bacterium]